ncbi:MAG: DUF1800 domain-containing protein [Bacteroidota bacterium]|jgi:uncharacterized protein (DUF1800 family)
MTYSLNPYGQPLTAAQAAHLLRRATFGPTQTEINNFTGLDATTAIQNLISAINYIPSPPVDLNETQTTAGQEYVSSVYDSTLGRNFDFRYYYKYWWINMMAKQGGSPSIIDKMTLFWQNHFVTTEATVDEYRAIYKYFMKVRSKSLENFKDFVRDITNDPAMLKFLNGNDSTKGTPNENYARELQELFVVGAKDFAGNSNYTENDVKAAARVLTGWRYRYFYTNGTTFVDSYFTLTRHDTTPKLFSSSYPDPVNPTLGTTISTPASIPVGYNNVGEVEIDDLLNMLFRHPETPKFICRKLYRFFVNPNVTQDIETNVIIPLANIFKSQDSTTGKTFEIKPIIQKLLSSEHFYDVANLGAIIKSPAEFVIGAYRFFNFPVPTIDSANLINSIKNHRTYAQYIYDRMNEMQMAILDQPTVFGYDAYFQTGYSRNWINTSQIGLRNSFTDKLVTGRTLVTGITPLVTIKIDMLAMVDKPTTATYNVTDAANVVELVTTNLLATALTANQKTFLTDTIMLALQPRTSWTSQWNTYKTTPNTTNTNTVKTKLENLMKYLLRMAEYSIC